MNLKNKRIVFLGDSITEGCGTTSESHAYHQLMKKEYELDLACNCGIGGTRIAQLYKPTYEASRFDLYFALRAQTMPKDADIVVVFGGTNDYGCEDGVEIGVPSSTNNYTFNGALNNLIIQLKKDYPKSSIVLLTPLHRTNEEISINGTGHILKDYSNAIIDAAKRHNVYLIDLFNEIELDPYDVNLLPDGLHPNDNGHKIIAKFLGEKLRNI